VVLCNPPFYAAAPSGAPRKGSATKQAAWVESTLDIRGFVRVAADLLSPGGSCFFVYPEGERGRLLAAVGAEAERLRPLHVAQMVHAQGEEPGESGRRLFVHVRRLGEPPPAAEPTPPEASVFALHRGDGEGPGGYTEEIEQWLRTLPPRHYDIRTPGW